MPCCGCRATGLRAVVAGAILRTIAVLFVSYRRKVVVDMILRGNGVSVPGMKVFLLFL